jgi:hypothetical protein
VPIAQGALLVIAVIEGDSLRQGTQGLGAPGALQRLGDGVLVVVTVRSAQLGQRTRVALARKEGREDGHAGHPRDLPDDLGALEMHLCSGLVPRLHMVGGVGQQPLAVTPGPAEHAHLLGRAEGPGEQVCVQALAPLTVEPIGLGAPRDALGLRRVDPQALHASRCQERTERNPVDPSRVHGNGGHATVTEPVGQGVEVDGARAETAHGVGGAPRGHGAPVLGCADIDARGVGVADLEGIREYG